MRNLAQRFEEEEAPTRKSENVPTATLVLASRVDRLAELAIEKLLVSPDEHALVSAAEDLAAIRRLAAKVIR